jgi:hypothetical protein
LGVNSDDDRDKLPAALRKHGITWRVGRVGRIAGRWGVTGWPAMYVLDAGGTIRFKDVRGLELDEAVDTLLKEAEKGKSR